MKMQTNDLLKIIRSIYDENFKYSKLDFWFRNDAFLYEDSKIGQGKTRYFDLEDVIVIVSCAVCLDATHNIEKSKVLANKIRIAKVEISWQIELKDKFSSLVIDIPHIKEEIEKHINNHYEVLND